MPAQRTDKKRKKVVVKNTAKEAEKIAKKESAASGKSKARKRAEDAKKKFAERNAAKIKLQERYDQAKSAKDKAALKAELENAEKELKLNDSEMKDAEAEEEKYKKDEEDADAMQVDEEEEVTDDEDNGDPDNPLQSTETPIASRSKLIMSLLAKERVDTPKHGSALDLTRGAGLRVSQAVVGYKSSGPFGQVGIVGDVEIEDHPIFRVRKNVTIDESKVPNIVEDRRAGKINPKTKKQWGVGDIQDIIGIAIAVPEGYTGDVEALVVPIKKLSGTEKDNLRDQKKPIPRQPDVQLGIQWWEPLENGALQSWENRTGCRTIWKKNGDATLLGFAKLFEGNYRTHGGQHSSEERSVSPFDIPPVGSSLSPETTPDPEQQASTTTTRENTPQTGSKKNAADKKAAREEFKIDWCEMKGIEPGDMTNTDDGNMMAAFKPFWEIMAAA